MERSSKQSSIRNPPNVDRLSDLPDSILCHILSFLPTYDAARTGVLARRWRFLWADVPTLDLRFFYRWNRRDKERPRTPVIFNRILSGRNLKALDTFRLHHTISEVRDKLPQRQFNKWVAAVIASGKVQNIELHFSYWMELPECLFTCKSLVDLRLRSCEIRISDPASISFPCLKKLRLCRVKYSNDETFQHLISGCSLLEELAIDDIDYRGLVCFRIFSPTLKWLNIHFGYCCGYQSLVEIITPALRYLQAKGRASTCISTKPLMSLSEANIELERWREVKVEDDVVYSACPLEFLDSMPNVKYLKFDIYWNEFLPSAFSSSSPRFHNLTQLEMAADWPFILEFLEKADNLQVLIVNRGTKDLKCWVEPQQVFSCLLFHLRSIAIKYFSGKEHECIMVRYLLKNAKVLASMKIRSYVYPPEKEVVALERILLFERGSEDCKLDFF